jgi:hypothetical protein
MLKVLIVLIFTIFYFLYHEYSYIPKINENKKLKNNDEIFWFIQITDLHLSYKFEQKKINFEHFLKKKIKMINPKFVLVKLFINLEYRRHNTLFS